MSVSIQKVLAAYDDQWMLVTGKPERYRGTVAIFVTLCDELRSKPAIAAGDAEAFFEKAGDVVSEQSILVWARFSADLLAALRADFGIRAEQIEAHLPSLLKHYRHGIAKTEGTLLTLVALSGFQLARLRSDAGVLGRMFGFASSEAREAKEAYGYVEQTLFDMWSAKNPASQQVVYIPPPAPAPVYVNTAIGCPSYGGFTTR